jgi:hypothetical protein
LWKLLFSLNPNKANSMPTFLFAEKSAIMRPQVKRIMHHDGSRAPSWCLWVIDGHHFGAIML